jgi:hypothetical protein
MLLKGARYVPALLWTVVILWLLLREPSGFPKIWWLDFVHSDKLVHAGLFALGAGLLTWALGCIRTGWAVVLMWAVMLGSATELLQHCCVPGRTGELSDLLADMLGAMVSFVLTDRFMSRMGTVT